MITKTELEFYERLPMTLSELTEEVAKLREAVEKCTGRPAPSEETAQVTPEPPEKEKHPAESPFDCLAVTGVQVYPFNGGANLGHTKGMAKIILNDQIVIRGLRVMEGENGLYVAYPIDPFYKGEDLRAICFPITRQLREHIENCVLEKYHDLIK